MHLPRLWLHVAAINPRRDPGRLFDAPAFGIAMERLGQGPFDHIVSTARACSAAPTQPHPDAADGLLLVTRRVQSTARDVRQAIDQLTPAKVLGTALLD